MRQGSKHKFCNNSTLLTEVLRNKEGEFLKIMRVQGVIRNLFIPGDQVKVGWKILKNRLDIVFGRGGSIPLNIKQGGDKGDYKRV